MATVVDTYNNELKPGVRVAFNYSGTVRIGTLIRVTPAKRYGKACDYSGEPYYNFEVLHDRLTTTSKITKRENLVVI